jgi:hypothetical protein
MLGDLVRLPRNDTETEGQQEASRRRLMILKVMISEAIEAMAGWSCTLRNDRAGPIIEAWLSWYTPTEVSDLTGETIETVEGTLSTVFDEVRRGFDGEGGVS